MENATMFTFSLTLDAFSVYVVAVDVVILLAYVLYLIGKRRRLERDMARINQFVAGYFANTGAEVRVSSTRPSAGGNFVVLLESPPLKRFRYSNFLESNLLAHIRQETGCRVDKVYWRFPIQLHKYEMAVPEDGVPAQDDLFLAGGLAGARGLDDYKVAELGWEEFAGARHGHAEAAAETPEKTKPG